MEENNKMADQLKETHRKLESIKIAGVQNTVIIDEPEDNKDEISNESDGNEESIKKYNSLVNGVKVK